jgi:hypothetical protein
MAGLDMKRALILVAAGGLVLVALSFALGNRPFRPRGDAEGHAELHRLGQRHQQAWSGRPNLSEYLVAAIHFTGPSNHYHGRYKAQRRALVEFGYLTNLSIPVPDLQPQVLQVVGVLSNTSVRAQAYAWWTLETDQDQVRLLCRTQDLVLWKETLAPFSN